MCWVLLKPQQGLVWKKTKKHKVVSKEDKIINRGVNCRDVYVESYNVYKRISFKYFNADLFWKYKKKKW